jgi:phosphoglycerate kinase
MERHSHDYFVQHLEKYFDLFVNDAFSAAHRSHGSVVGFNTALESYPGLIMKKELESITEIRDNLDSPLLVLGGEKPSDIIGVIDQMVERVDKILLGGIPGELGLIIKGHELGEKSGWISEHGFDAERDKLEKILEEHGEKIVLPEDLRTESGNYGVGDVPNEMTWDIGENTRKKFVKEIKDAESVVMKGPMGAFEDYPDGTREVVDAIAENDGFTVLGGGHTSSLIHRFDHDLDEFTHVSIAGGAFVRFMSGEELPGVEALDR